MKNVVCIIAIALLLPACGGTMNQDAQPDSEEATKALFEAARSSNPDNIIELLNNGAEVNSIDEEGRTALDIAVTKQQWHAARLLYRQGARLETADYKNIVEAARVGDIERVRRFLAVGGNVDKRGNGLWTPLHYAAENGDRELADILIANGADINAPAGLFFLLADGSSALLTVDPLHDRQSPFGKTPLHRAAGAGYKDVVQLLIDAGCGINPLDKGVETPLDVAATKKIEELLRAHGAVSGKELKEKQGEK